MSEGIKRLLGDGIVKIRIKKIDFLYLIQIFAILAMVLPTCFTCLYMVPVADDFSNALTVRGLLSNEGDSYFMSAITFSKTLYLNLGGYYFAAFLNAYFTPFLRFGIVGIRVFGFVCNLLFFSTVYFLVRAVMRNMAQIKDNNFILTVYIAFLFCLTNIYLNIESSFWYCVSVAYVLPLVFGLLGACAFIAAICQEKKPYGIIAVLFGFLASGSSLNLAALHCFLYLVIGMYGFFIKGKKKTAVFGVGFAFLGGMINLIAPGNFARREIVSSNYNIGEALMRACSFVNFRIYNLLSTSLLSFVLVALFFAFAARNLRVKVYNKIHPVLIAVLLWLVLVILAFPVYLGYDSNYFPDRCVFVQDMAMYIFLFVLTAYSAVWVQKRYHLEVDTRFFLRWGLVLFVPFCMWHSGKTIGEAYPSFYLASQIVNGNDASFAGYWRGVLGKIKSADAEDVIIHEKAFDNQSVLISPQLSEDPEHWVNEGVAQYYGKKSVTLVYDEEQE